MIHTRDKFPVYQAARTDRNQGSKIIQYVVSSLPGFHQQSVMSTQPGKALETVTNPAPERDYTIRLELPEFTCLCPKTGQPDFATLFIEYVPDRLCIELKSLKLYIWSYRDTGIFHEAAANMILADLVNASRPRFMRVKARFNVRGGIYTTVISEHAAKGWKPSAVVELP